MFTIADIVAQNYQIGQNKKKLNIETKYDLKRTFIAATMGTVFMTPIIHYWITFILPGMVSRYK